jgi:hypothetical protein
MIPFFLAGAITAGVVVHSLLCQTLITVNEDAILVKYELSRLSYTRKRQTQGLDTITEEVVYKKNYQPVYGIGLFFRNQSKLKFGSALKAEERRWLIGELYEMKDLYVKPLTSYTAKRPR